MNPTDQFWSIYLRLQDAVMSPGKISKVSMGMEGALTALLERAAEFEGMAPDAADAKIEKLLNSSICREGNRARIRVRRQSEFEPNVNLERGISAAVLLRELCDSLSVQDWGTVLQIAMGSTYQELATSAVSAATLRVRVLRTRQSLRSAA